MAATPPVDQSRDQLVALRFEEGALWALDQTALPTRHTELELRSADAVADAIKRLAIRGAPLIGVAAGYGVAIALAAEPEDTSEGLALACELLTGARPTAVNLFAALTRLSARFEELAAQPALEIEQALVAEADAIAEEDIASCLRIGEHGAPLLSGGTTVLTHCNAGALATAGYGTALGVIRGAVAQGKAIRVFADETRPFLQGARLTAWELARDGIPVEILTDSMAGHFLSRGEIAAVVVGADRIAANGDTANKIGTYPLAVLAKENGVPFYVAAPATTLDLACPDGSGIPIEERTSAEVLSIGGRMIAPEGVVARHVAFDVTPARYITAIVTDEGICRPPYLESLAESVRRAAERSRQKPTVSR